MLLKFRKSRLVGTRAYAVGEVAEVPDEVAKDLIASKVASITTEAPKAEKSEDKPVDADKPAETEKPVEPAKAAKKK